MPHRHPASGVSVGNIHVYSKLWLTTDTYPKIRKTCFYHRLTCDLVAINHAAGIFTLRSKLTCSLLHSHRLRTDSVCLILRHFGDNSCFFALFALISHYRSRRQGSWVGDDIVERRLLDALVLILWNFANFKQLIKNKATVDVTGYVYYIQLLCYYCR